MASLHSLGLRCELISFGYSDRSGGGECDGIQNTAGEFILAQCTWILLGGYVGFTCIQTGETALGFALLAFALAGVLIWLDVRAIAWPLIIWFGIVIVSWIDRSGFSRACVSPNLGNLDGHGLTIHDLYAWRNAK